VQCNTCDKWRSLPPHVDITKLPDIWTCDQNIYDTSKNSCDAPEEDYEDVVDGELRSFFKLWTKRLKNADRAEARFSSVAVTRGRKRKLECEWIQCCNPACGKWRPITARNLDSTALLRKLNKDRGWSNPKKGQWFCSMNSWDETQGKSSVPELYECVFCTTISIYVVSSLMCAHMLSLLYGCFDFASFVCSPSRAVVRLSLEHRWSRAAMRAEAGP